MADDEDAPAKDNSKADEEFEVGMEFVESLPGGRAAMPVECKGKFVWLVVNGHVSPQARDEMVTDLNHIVRSGLWQQNWQPPQDGH